MIGLLAIKMALAVDLGEVPVHLVTADVDGWNTTVRQSLEAEGIGFRPFERYPSGIVISVGGDFARRGDPYNGKPTRLNTVAVTLSVCHCVFSTCQNEAFDSWERPLERSEGGLKNLEPIAREVAIKVAASPRLQKTSTWYHPDADPKEIHTFLSGLPTMSTTTDTVAAPGESWVSIDEPLRMSRVSADDAALVVGIEDYAFVEPARYARRDAEAMRLFLVYTMGVPADRVRVLTEGSHDTVRSAAVAVGQSVRPGSTVWIYFAGHGLVSPSSGERLLLGDDTRSDPALVETRAIALSEVQQLASAGQAHSLTLVDAAFDGTTRGGGELLGGTRFAVPEYAMPAENEGVTWLASGDGAPGVLPSVSHGGFTYFAIRALRGEADGEIDGRPDGAVSAGEALAWVTRMCARHEQPQAVWSGPSSGVLVEPVP